MFSKLFDFSYRRNYLEALIFFIFWSAIYILAFFSIFKISEIVFDISGLDVLVIVFFLIPVRIFFYIYFLYRVVKKRNLNFNPLIFLVLIIIEYLLGSVSFLWLVVPSYLTTLESKPQVKNE